MPTSSPRRREIVAAAREILEKDGPDGLSMRAIAERLDIRAPSLYKHFADKHAIEHALISVGFDEQATAFGQAAQAPLALHAIAEAYRKFARDHPHLYRLMTEKPLDRTRLAEGAEARASLPILHAFGGDIDAARAAWAFAHGMTILELNQRFPDDADIEAAWDRGLALFARSVPPPSSPLP